MKEEFAVCSVSIPTIGVIIVEYLTPRRRLIVDKVEANFPAQLAGVGIGDEIFHVNDMRIDGMSLQMIASMCASSSASSTCVKFGLRSQLLGELVEVVVWPRTMFVTTTSGLFSSGSPVRSSSSLPPTHPHNYHHHHHLQQQQHGSNLTPKSIMTNNNNSSNSVSRSLSWSPPKDDSNLNHNVSGFSRSSSSPSPAKTLGTTPDKRERRVSLSSWCSSNGSPYQSATASPELSPMIAPLPLLSHGGDGLPQFVLPSQLLVGGGGGMMGNACAAPSHNNNNNNNNRFIGKSVFLQPGIQSYSLPQQQQQPNISLRRLSSGSPPSNPLDRLSIVDGAASPAEALRWRWPQQC